MTLNNGTNGRFGMLQDKTNDPVFWTRPKTPWLMKQIWSNLLFIHWPVEPERLRPLIPGPLKLDCFEHTAWLTVLPFRVGGIRLRGMPPLPDIAGSFPEINVRTYVACGGRPGVYFFTLEAGNPLAAWMARWLYKLPYHASRLRMQTEGDEVRLAGARRSSGRTYGFACRYRPASEPRPAVPGSLDEWLTDRLSLYTSRYGRLYRGDIFHEPWRLSIAEAVLDDTSLPERLGFPVENGELRLHYAHRMEASFWPLVQLGRQSGHG